jgi:hypothetical protein
MAREVPAKGVAQLEAAKRLEQAAQALEKALDFVKKDMDLLKEAAKIEGLTRDQKAETWSFYYFDDAIKALLERKIADLREFIDSLIEKEKK